MKLRILIILLMVAIGVNFVNATDDPHGATASIDCSKCHIGHNSMGDILINATDSLVSTMCLSCHTPGGWVGMTKYFSVAEKADPGTSGIHHAWDVPADNSARGAAAPTTQILLDHLTADNRITCATCHDPHSNTISPFLRLDNSADALCLDCHALRNTTSVRTYTGSKLSHPVNVTLPATETFHNPPLDIDGNPQPSDGNTTNDLPLVGGKVSCTTCHSVHHADSDASTDNTP